MPSFTVDPELERSTNRWMVAGIALIALFVAAFPLYRMFEPANRAERRAAQLRALAADGQQLYAQNCASCHGVEGEGGTGPALNSSQFQSVASDDQTFNLVAVGVPGTQMSAWSQDHGGPFTSEQIRAVVAYVRAWADGAPDRPDWRRCCEAPAAQP